MRVCLTFDFDGPGTWITHGHRQDLTAVSRGEFGLQGMTRVLALLETHRVSATFFVPAHTALLHSALIRDVVARGHEIAHHGWAHEIPTELDAGTEVTLFERAYETLAEVVGDVPVGYRAPAWQLTDAISGELERRGFRYDSSCMGSDVVPYLLRVGDQWSRDARSTVGKMSRVVEMPVHWDLDDAPLFEFAAGFTVRSLTNQQIGDLWVSEYDHARENEPEGILTLTLHPHVIARGARIEVLRQFVLHTAAHDATFSTMREAATEWQNRAKPGDRPKQGIPTDVRSRFAQWFSTSREAESQ